MLQYRLCHLVRSVSMKSTPFQLQPELPTSLQVETNACVPCWIKSSKMILQYCCWITDVFVLCTIRQRCPQYWFECGMDVRSSLPMLALAIVRWVGRYMNSPVATSRRAHKHHHRIHPNKTPRAQNPPPHSSACLALVGPFTASRLHRIPD